MNTLLDLNVKFYQPAELNKELPSAALMSTPQTSSDAHPQAGSSSIAFVFPPTPVSCLEDRLVLEAELVQLVLAEAEAAFKSPVRHFFNPGGQQLLYNQN